MMENYQPTEPETSHDNGSWIELQGKLKMSSNEIIEKIKKIYRI